MEKSLTSTLFFNYVFIVYSQYGSPRVILLFSQDAFRIMVMNYGAGLIAS
ncbi:MAG: hypothetical protein QW506_01355 [Thermoproteota archaeon]